MQFRPGGQWKYSPEELNKVFWKANKHILRVITLYEAVIKSSKEYVDHKMLEEQIHIIHEKFAHDLLKSLADSQAKFANFPLIQRNIQIADSGALRFYVVVQANRDIEAPSAPKDRLQSSTRRRRRGTRRRRRR